MEPVQTAGIPLAGFVGDAGAAAPAAKGNLPTCRGTGGRGCPHSRRGWLGRAAQPPAPPACRGRPLLWGSPSSWPALPPSSWGAGGARTHVARTIQTDARTPTRAHGRVPTGAEVAAAWALGLPGSRGPRLPPAASREPVPRGTARQQAAGALPAAPRSLGVPAADAEETPSQARRALTSTGGATRPPAARSSGNGRPARGRAGGASSRRAACGSRLRLDGAEALTCRPA